MIVGGASVRGGRVLVRDAAGKWCGFPADRGAGHGGFLYRTRRTGLRARRKTPARCGPASGQWGSGSAASCRGRLGAGWFSYLPVVAHHSDSFHKFIPAFAHGVGVLGGEYFLAKGGDDELPHLAARRRVFAFGALAQGYKGVFTV